MIRWTQTGRIVYDRVSTPFTWKDVDRVSKAPEVPDPIFDFKQFLSLVRTAARCNAAIGESTIFGLLSFARDATRDLADSGLFRSLRETVRRLLDVRQAPEVEEWFSEKAFPFPDPLLPFPDPNQPVIEREYTFQDLVKELDAFLRGVYEDLGGLYGKDS